MARDHYKTLGVSRDATDAAIKEAYRRCVKRHHPDLHCDHACQERIREINEAYEVLGNSERRDQYDIYLSAHERRAASSRDFGKSERYRAYSGWGGDVGGWSRDGAARGITDPWDCFEMPYELLVYLSRREAGEGVRATIAVTYPLRCTQCGGTGTWYGIIPCSSCLGQGFSENTVPVRVEVPPGTEHGDIIRARGGFYGDMMFHCRIIIE
ncbi:MAG: DnaJ domain-containing protein [Spirochaetes bacterium]|nr:DnaJ domain-containing protein [Spirochaetota bacterium]